MSTSGSGDNDWKWSAEQSDYYRYTYNRDGTWGRVEWGRSRLPDPDSPPMSRPQPATQQPPTQPPPPQKSQSYAYPLHSTTSATNQSYPVHQPQVTTATQPVPGHSQQPAFSQYGAPYAYSPPAYAPTAPSAQPSQPPNPYATAPEGANAYATGEPAAPSTTSNNNSQNPNPYRQDPWSHTRRTGP